MGEKISQELACYLKAGFSLFHIHSAEEIRVIKEIMETAKLMADGNIVNLGKIFSEDKEVIENLEKLFVKVKGKSKINKNNSTVKIDLNQFKEIENYLSERPSAENNILKKMISLIIKEAEYDVVIYRITDGFSCNIENKYENQLIDALEETIKKEQFSKNNIIFVFLDVTSYFRNGVEGLFYCRKLRDICEYNLLIDGDIQRSIILVHAESWDVPESLKHLVTEIEFKLPDVEQLKKEFSTVLSAPGFDGTVIVPDENLTYEIVSALTGLTTNEAQNVLFYCGVKYKGFGPEIVPELHKHKKMIFADDEVLEYNDFSSLPNIENLAGYGKFIEFIDECRACNDPLAIQAGIKAPKGVLLLGLPGTGKSVVAAAAAKRMKLPLIKYDFSSVFNSLVGESESRQRRALKRISAQGRCVVLIDEADKAFNGADSSSGDSGVSSRLLGKLLSWMANENKNAFIIMTMNRLADPYSGRSIVPVEMLRAGRLDAVFYTDFPSKSERDLIFHIHMKNNGASWEKINQETRNDIIKTTENYVGSELEQICIKAVRTAWSRRKETQPTGQEVLEAKKSINPVAKLDQTNINFIREFCKTCGAIPVNGPTKVDDLEPTNNLESLNKSKKVSGF